jgi:hypothetical protein
MISLVSIVPKPLATEVMRTETSLYADETRRQIGEPRSLNAR